ncbi:tetratricopeptide repeat protein 28-like isoform X3 [Orbicella faveolata]|nr:tetratricopeptide repeat protein 28-like isoform X3 [Orbicella faveolata]
MFSARGEFKKAIEYHKLYLSITKERGDKEAERIAYSSLGIAFYKLGDFKKALHYHNLHLGMAKEAGNKVEEGSAYCNLGHAFLGLSDFQKAKEYHNLDLAIAKEIGSKAAEARAYGNLGNAFYGFGDFRKGIEYQHLRLAIVKELGNKAWEGDAYGDLGIGFFNLGDFEKVMEYYTRHLSISREVRDKDMEGRACHNLGNAYYHLGNLRKSIEYYSLRLRIAKELGNKYDEGSAYGALGSAFYKLGDFKKAIDNFLLNLSTAEESGNKAVNGLMHCNLGNAFFSLGDYKKAKEHHRVDLAISKEMRDRAGEGRAYGNLANDFSGLGDLDMAVKYHKQHLSVAKEVGDKTGQGRAHDNLGTVYQRRHMFKEAIEHHKLALGLAKEVGEKAAEGRATGNLGGAFEGLGESDKAISYYKVLLGIAKEVGDKDMEGHAYQVLGNSHESLGHLSEAQECYQSSVRLYNDVRSLLRSKDEWKINFRHKNHFAYNALWRILLKEDKIVEALFAAEEGRAQALTDLMESQYGVPASQSGSRGQDTTDFEMLKCIPSSTSFQALDKDTITSWVIVEGKPEAVGRKVFAHDATTFFRVLVRIAYNSIGVRAGVSCEDRSMDALREDAFPDETSQPTSTPQESSLNTLYNIIIRPISNLLQGSELIIAPDGPLWLAPYAAFTDTDSKYLCESFRIRLIPSLTSLKMIADCPEEYHCRSGALLVGDPWLVEVTNSKGQKLLEQLTFAKMEAEMIGKILNVVPLIGKKATKAEVLRRLSSVALVHVAAHGREETGEIALTPDPKRASRIPTEEDYILTIADVLSVQMRARLVVLSCCHSGRGEIKAEGVVGIARAFMGAGARSVLVSLWAIDDEATLEFMRSFYRHLVEGRSASESLNLAMKSLRESDKYSDVKYWAPFVLIGDDVTLEFGAKK